MGGLLTALEIGRRSLLTTQQQLSVTGNNVANADRAGFRRREAITQSTLPIDTPVMELGTGVQVAKVIRAIDESLESSLRQAIQSSQYHETHSGLLSRLENRLAPAGGDALGEAMAAFDNDLIRLTAAPELRELRGGFLNAARGLAGEVNSSWRAVRELREDIADATGRGLLPEGVERLNALARQVADLNRQIVTVEQHRFRPQPANDLRDARGELLGKLSALTNFTSDEAADGSVTLRIGTETLVSGSTARGLGVETSGGVPVVAFTDTGALATIDAGQAGALLTTWQYLADREVELDAFAVTLRDEVNTLLAAGYDMDGAAGASLFSGAGAADLAVSLTNPRKLGLSAIAGETGHGGQAQALREQLATALPALGDRSLGDYPGAWLDPIVSDVAAGNSAADQAAATEAMFAEAVASKSGVSLDEEMIHMLQLQRSYQASAKFVAAVDEMLQQALSML